MWLLSSMWLSLAAFAGDPAAAPFDAKAALTDMAVASSEAAPERMGSARPFSAAPTVDPEQAAYDRSSRRMSIFMISAGAVITTLGAMNVYAASHTPEADVPPGTKEFGIMGLVCGPIAIAFGVAIWPRPAAADR